MYCTNCDKRMLSCGTNLLAGRRIQSCGIIQPIRLHEDHAAMFTQGSKNEQGTNLANKSMISIVISLPK